MRGCIVRAPYVQMSKRNRSDRLSCIVEPVLLGEGNNDWGELWQLGPKGYWEAWDAWMGSEPTITPTITPCPSTLEHNWPPTQH